ncbi:MAG TPA: hypothetical protein DIU15_10475 [Deltaproteobacteria bacterium]|nr:hypothetical protein [Deltaproteobacteria bacterium]HCP46460.1 hypothetical protein [Deltaproteobacteria bacterium]
MIGVIRSLLQAHRGLARSLAAFLVGLFSGAALSAAAVVDYPLERLEVFAQALSVIHDRYVEPRDPDELLYDAIGGLTQGLDDNSVFLDPERYQRLREQTSGEYYGVGISIEQRDGRLFIITPLAGSPAMEAGLLAGDEIVAIDGVEVAQMDGNTALGRIKGPRGSVVTLRVRRSGENEPLDVVVTRDQVRTQSVELRPMGDGLYWLRIERFQRRTVEEVKRELNQLRKSRGSPAGLVVDLRDNPGGYLGQAVAVADLWLDEGVIVSTINRSSTPERDMARGAGTDLETPLAVLVNAGSASAAEIVAAALQDRGRATVIGFPTYGKGSVQQFFDLGDGSALKITTARYYTPLGRSIHGSGVEPDISLVDRSGQGRSQDTSSLLEQFPSAKDWVRADPSLHVAFASLTDADSVERWQATASEATASVPGPEGRGQDASHPE